MDSRTKKGILGGAAVFMCAALFMGGTFAWKDFSQHQVNRFRGNVYHDVTLHDDFDGENKDVYVENSGENTIYVRVRLDEYMHIGNTNMLGQDITQDGSVTAKTKEQWVPHTYDAATIGDCGHDSSIQFHSYYEWNMSGAQIKYDPGTPGMVSSVLDGVKTDSDGNEVKDAYGQKIPIVDPTKGTKDTLASAAPITMAKYISLAEEAAVDEEAMAEEDKLLWQGVKSGCWILDIDGWAYWSQPLQPGNATNLLLDEVKMTTLEPTDDWHYAIDVKLQAVSLDEAVTTWQVSGGYSDSVAKLIEAWQG